MKVAQNARRNVNNLQSLLIYPACVKGVKIARETSPNCISKKCSLNKFIKEDRRGSTVFTGVLPYLLSF